MEEFREGKVQGEKIECKNGNVTVGKNLTYLE